MSGFWSVILLALGFLVLYALWSGKPGMMREYRDEAEGLADLLRYATPIDDGVLLGKGGELIAGFFYRGADTESATNPELDAVSARLNVGLARLGSGWMVHIEAIRDSAIGYPAEGEFYSPVLQMLDEERRQQYNREDAHYESVYAIVFTYLPPSRLESKAVGLMFDKSADLVQTSKSVHDVVLGKFKNDIAELQSQLASAVEGMTRMGVGHVLDREGQVVASYDSLLAFLHYCVTGIRQVIRTPKAGMYVDTIIGSQDFVGGNTPKIGSRHIRIVSIDGFPASAYSGILGQLNALPVAYRWSTRFIFLENTEATNYIDKIRKKWKQKVRGMKDQMMNTSSGAVDEHAAGMTADAQTAMSEVQSGLVRHGHYTSVVVLMDEDHERVDLAARETLSLIRNRGFTSRIEDVNSVEAFLGSLPGNGHENVRRPVIHTLNLAHLVPTTATWPGPVENPCPFYPEKSPTIAVAETTGNAPFRLNLHVGDVGHTLILGPTGSGKSTLLEFLIAQHFRYPRAKVFKFEKGYSSFVLTHAVGGLYYDLGAEESAAGFCPLGQVHKPSERIWAEGYIETLLEIQGVTMTPKRRAAVREALQLLGGAGTDADRRTMTDFVATLQDAELQEALKFYTLSADNEMLDAKSDSLQFSRLTVFEMEHLMEMGERHVIPVLLYLFRRVERQLDGSPVLLVLDEAWLMLTHPLFQKKIKEWLKVLRKANCSVIFATQSISDVGNCAIRDVVYESCQTKLLLPNPQARQNEESLKQYRLIGLNERQIDQIAFAEQKRDYYYMSPLGRRMFRLGLGPVALSLVGVSGKEDVSLARQLLKAHGRDWYAEWLKHCAQHKGWGKGLDQWARLLQDATRRVA